MKLIVNGEAIEAAATTLTLLLDELGYEHDFLATARNSELVPAETRSECLLSESDRIEILSPMQGG